MKRPPLPRCDCGKVHSSDMDEARKTHAHIWAELGGESLVRFYQCTHGSYHWTRALDPNYHLKEAA
jgi:hypothetical protein